MIQANHDPYALLRAHQLALSCEPAEAQNHSFHNYHVKGLDYLCLFRSPRYTAKVYFIDPLKVEMNEEGFLVNPHTHGYAFRQTVLAGGIWNHRFRKERGDAGYSYTYREAHYYSPLTTGEAPEFVWQPDKTALWHKPERCYQHEGYFMDMNEVHTIEPDESSVTVLFTEQFHDFGLDYTLYYDRTGRTPSLDGLYTPMTKDAAEVLIDKLLAY